MANPYGFMNCPHCGAETTVDPALVSNDSPMIYCDECDEPLFGNDNRDEFDPDYIGPDEPDGDGPRGHEAQNAEAERMDYYQRHLK